MNGRSSASLTLYHTNDLHNHLTDAQAQVLGTLRAQSGSDSLLLDAGDAIGAGNATYHRKGEPILTRMSLSGYDAMTVGNREFHVTQIGFRSKLSCATFPVLCANVRAKRSVSAFRGEGENLVTTSSDPDLPVRSHLLIETSMGWRVVVFGLTVPMITKKMQVRMLSSYLFEDAIETAQRLVPQLRAIHRPDVLVALTHIGLPQDRLLASQIPGIDLIIGGHTHVVLEHGEWVGSTLLVQAGSYGKQYGRVEVQRSPDGSSLHMRACLEAL